MEQHDLHFKNLVNILQIKSVLHLKSQVSLDQWKMIKKKQIDSDIFIQKYVTIKDPNPVDLFKNSIETKWRRMEILLLIPMSYHPIKRMFSDNASEMAIKVEILFTILNIIAVILLFASYRSKYGFHLVYSVYFILCLENIMRVSDFHD